MKKSLVSIPLINLSLASLLGAFLRFIPLRNIEGVNYRFFLHAHSHVAFLGWVYMALFLMIVFAFIPENLREKKTYRIQFWATQLSVTGMLVSFPLQGYGLFSIIFSSAHILLSYVFAAQIIKDTPGELKGRLSYRFLLAALLFMVLSSAGPWSLGAIMSSGMSGSDLYNLAIYFYLHFEYNGFFTLGIFALLIRALEINGVYLSPGKGNLFFWLLTVSTAAGYTLSTLWTAPPMIIQVTAILSAVVQVAALFIFLRMLLTNRALLPRASSLPSILLYVACGSFIVKVVLQFFSAFINIYTFRNIIIAYLHLTLIGFVTFYLLARLIQEQYIRQGVLLKAGLILMLAGFTGSELILFLQGALFLAGHGLIPAYDLLLFSLTVTLPVGILLLVVASLHRNIRSSMRPPAQDVQVRSMK